MAREWEHSEGSLVPGRADKPPDACSLSIAMLKHPQKTWSPVHGVIPLPATWNKVTPGKYSPTSFTGNLGFPPTPPPHPPPRLCIVLPCLGLRQQMFSTGTVLEQAVSPPPPVKLKTYFEHHEACGHEVTLRYSNFLGRGWL